MGPTAGISRLQGRLDQPTVYIQALVRHLGAPHDARLLHAKKVIFTSLDDEEYDGRCRSGHRSGCGSSPSPAADRVSSSGDPVPMSWFIC